MRYRVVVTETQLYEVYVEADNREEAEEIALEEYGCEGDIFSTYADVTHIEEEE
jgi:hypothetical protein